MASSFYTFYRCHLLISIGPGSYLSICSSAGAEWVSRQIGAPVFTDSAASLTTKIDRDLKMQTPMHNTRAPDPHPDLARSYSAGAYFAFHGTQKTG